MLEENTNPLRRGGEFIFYHELDGEFFFSRLEICEREGDILLVLDIETRTKNSYERFEGLFWRKASKYFET